jgi:hypothetical protein
MTTPGDSGEKPESKPSEAASSGAYEPPPIEHTQGQPSYQPPPGATPPQGYPPTSGYPPPGYPPPGYTPPPGYGPPSGSSQGGYSPPSYSSEPSGYPPPPPPQYGTTPGSGYPPPYGQPGYAGGYPQQSQTNTLALWSLVASLIGILCSIGSFVGIALGIVALNQIKETRQGGRGLAVAGIVVGVVSLVISAIWYLIVFSG